MTNPNYISDIPLETAQRSFYGVSFHLEQRGERARDDYAMQLATDFETLREQAQKGNTLDLLDAEFERYRQGYRKRYLAYLHSSSRCVSSFIAGPSNFPARRMNKRADIAHKRLNELFDFRARALAAIKRTLRPDLRPIYASDGDAIECLEAKISQAEALQERMKTTNATIRKYRKDGEQAQVAALLAMGYHEGTARKLLQPDFCGRIGFADYQLTNNGANIRRMKARVEQITQLQATPATEIEGGNARVEDCPSDNRVRLFFPGKPDEQTRSELKRNGFRWSPTIGCWQAYRHNHTIELAKRFAGVNKTVIPRTLPLTAGVRV